MELSRTTVVELYEDRIELRTTVRGTSVLKVAEDGADALVVRAYETAGRGGEATIEVLGRSVTAVFGPAEIKTFREPRDPAEPVVETDLVEWSP